MDIRTNAGQQQQQRSRDQRKTIGMIRLKRKKWKNNISGSNFFGRNTIFEFFGPTENFVMTSS